MATTKNTKKAIADAFKELLGTMPFEQIRVGDICERSGRNRKSFYYHFKDKYDLVCQIFDSELIARLREEVLLEDVDFEEVSLEVVTYFYENRSIYRKLFPLGGQNSFREHFGRMLEGFMREAMGLSESDGARENFVALFYTDAILEAIERWLNTSPPAPPDIFLGHLRAALRSFPRHLGGDTVYWENGN